MFTDISLAETSHIYLHFMDIFKVGQVSKENSFDIYVPVVYFSSKTGPSAIGPKQSSSAIVSGKLKTYDSASDIIAEFKMTVYNWLSRGIQVYYCPTKGIESGSDRVLCISDLDVLMAEAMHRMRDFAKNYVYGNKEYRLYHMDTSGKDICHIEAGVHTMLDLYFLIGKLRLEKKKPFDIQCEVNTVNPQRNVCWYQVRDAVEQYYVLSFLHYDGSVCYIAACHGGRYALSVTHHTAMKFEHEKDAMEFAFKHPSIFHHETFEVKEINEYAILYQLE